MGLWRLSFGVSYPKAVPDLLTLKSGMDPAKHASQVGTSSTQVGLDLSLCDYAPDEDHGATRFLREG